MAINKSGLEFLGGHRVVVAPQRGPIIAAMLAAAMFAACPLGSAGAADPYADYDLAMYSRPSLGYSKYSTFFPEGLKELWLKALERPDAELQRMLIDTFAIAHRRGLEGMSEAKPRLLELLREPDQRLDVLRAIAQTLVVMDARESADILNELASKHGLSIAQIVEPALAKWDSKILQETWIQRIENAEVGSTLMTLAIDGLGSLEAAEATEPLQAIVRNPGQSVLLRMSSARALGKIHDSGQLELAESLAATPSTPAELNAILAIEIIDRHEDTKAVDFFNGMVGHESTIIQGAALERLYRIDFHLVDQHADRLITSNDVNVRRWCARAMMATEDVGRIALLAGLLDDVNPGLRREVASGLIKLAEIPELHDPIIDRTTEVLNRNEWRGCEQACVVLARLDHKPSGRRMVELLGHERGEVKVASAWGLTQLQIEELLPDMLDHAQSVYEGFRSRQLNDSMSGASLHVAHLFIAFGDQKYMAANPLMRKYLPKNFSIGYETRPAAAWALGMLYADDPQDDLIEIMTERLNDTGSMEPEADDVRAMCAISLGRMKAESSLDSLRRNALGLRACYWAIEQITGEPMPRLEDVSHEISDWFLGPIRDYQ